MELAGKLWATVDHDVKLKYMNIYYEHRAKYTKELSEYKASLKEKKLSTLSEEGKQQNLAAVIKLIILKITFNLSFINLSFISNR